MNAATLRDALPTDAEIRRLREHALSIKKMDWSKETWWRSCGQHIVTIADNLERRKATALDG